MNVQPTINVFEVNFNIPNNDNETKNKKKNNKINNKITDKQIEEFSGSHNSKLGWKECMYCIKYFPPSMYLPNIEYCGHCWAWLNSNQFDLENGIYLGTNSIIDVKNYLKNTIGIHKSIICTNSECIYNKIDKLYKENKLNEYFSADLCLEVKTNNYSKNCTKDVDKITNLKINSNPKIDFEKSYISI